MYIWPIGTWKVLHNTNHQGPTNQNDSDVYHLTYTSQNGCHQQETTVAGEDVENKKHCALLTGMWIDAATVETIWRFLKN